MVAPLPETADFARVLSAATAEELQQLQALLDAPKIPFAPQAPTARQQLFLDLTYVREVLYGGAAGGGKSSALLLAASQYVDNPDYHAILFRRTFTDLTLTDSLISRSMEWWLGKGPTWSDKTKTWRFPSGATISFGYLENEIDKYRYQSAAWQFIGFDELTHFTETQYLYLFSRLRRNSSGQGNIPLRMRAGSNPGGVGHEWVKKRFLGTKYHSQKRSFVPAKLEDNPHLDQAAYIESLNELDPITRKQLLAGDWDAFEGGRFRREWFRHVYRNTPHAYFLRLPGGKEEEVAKMLCTHFTICDPAAKSEEVNDPTAIVAFAATPKKQMLVLDVVRERLDLEDILPTVADVAIRNGSDYVGLEDVAFQWALVKLGRRTQGMPPVKAITPGGKGKLARATMAIVKAEAGEIFLPEHAAWKDDYIAEHVLFTGIEKKPGMTGQRAAKADAHDDQVDCTAYGAQQTHFVAVPQVAKSPEEQESRRTLLPTRESSQGRRGLFGRR